MITMRVPTTSALYHFNNVQQYRCKTFCLISIVIGRLEFSTSSSSRSSSLSSSSTLVFLSYLSPWTVYNVRKCVPCLRRFNSENVYVFIWCVVQQYAVCGSSPLNMFLFTRFSANIPLQYFQQTCKQINYGNFMPFHKEMKYRSMNVFYVCVSMGFYLDVQSCGLFVTWCQICVEVSDSWNVALL